MLRRVVLVLLLTPMISGCYAAKERELRQLAESMEYPEGENSKRYGSDSILFRGQGTDPAAVATAYLVYPPGTNRTGLLLEMKEIFEGKGWKIARLAPSVPDDAGMGTLSVETIGDLHVACSAGSGDPRVTPSDPVPFECSFWVA